MTQYIDKSAVVAEIEKRMQELRPTNTHKMQVGVMDRDILMWLNALTWVKDFLDTLEVKDVDEIIKNAEDHAYFAGSENTREKLIDKACEWLRKGGTGWYLTTEFGENEIDFVKLAEDFRKAMKDET